MDSTAQIALAKAERCPIRHELKGQMHESCPMIIRELGKLLGREVDLESIKGYGVPSTSPW